MQLRRFVGSKLNLPRVVLLCLSVIAFGLRITGARSSIAYIPDTQIVREAFDIAQQHSLRQAFDINLNNELKYPLTLPYYLVAIYGLIFVFGFVLRIFPNLATFVTFLFTQRETIHWIAVVSLAVITTTAVPLAYVVSRKLNRNHTGWLFAGLVAFDLLSVQMSHQARPHAPLAALAFMAVAVLCGFTVGKGSWVIALTATLMTALTFGVLQSGAVVFVPYGLAWLIRVVDSARAGRFWREAGLCAINVVILAGLTFLLYPPAFSEYPRLAYNIVTGSQRFDLGGGSHTFGSMDFGLQYVPAFASGFFGYQPLQTVFFPIALAVFVWKLRSQWRILAVGLPLPLINLMMWAIYYDSSPRFWATLALFNDLIFAYLLEELIVWSASFFKVGRWKVLTVAVVVAVVPAAVNAIRLVVVMSQPDTRTLASEWVEANTPTNSTIIGNFQMLELLPNQKSLQRQSLDYPGSLGTYGQWLLQQGPATYPAGPTFDIVDFGLYWQADQPEKLFKDLNIQYAIAQTSYSDLAIDQSLIKYVRQHGQAVEVFCPGWNIEAAYLPIDIYGWAWQEIWRVERPGPIVVIYQLDGVGQSSEAALACQR